MKCSLKIKSFIVKGKDEKDAYIRGMKKYACFIATKKYSNLSIKINRLKDQNDCLEFVFYTDVDLSEQQKKFCKLCKEYHHSFFINEDYNCKRCNLRTFFTRLNSDMNISKSFYKGVIE